MNVINLIPRREEEAIQAREEAIERVDRNADEEWKSAALDAVFLVCQNLPRFTSDDIWDTGLPRPRTPSALGPIQRKAAALGWCQKVPGEWQMTRDRVRHRELQVWESLL